MPCIFTQSIMNRAWNASDTDILLKYIREGKSVEYISKKQNRYIHRYIACLGFFQEAILVESRL
jgi:hypothetical protein